MATSAGLFALGGAFGDLLAPTGAALFSIGLVLSFVSLALLVISARRFRQAAPAPNSWLGRVAAATELAGGSSAAVLSVGVPTMLLSAPFRTTQLFYLIGLLMTTAGAFAFLAAVALPAVTLAGRIGRTKAIIAVSVGVSAVVGELVLSLPFLREGPNWFLFGGFPFLNWNVPFGILAAVCALLLKQANGDVRVLD
jgi:hypothetical protein